MVGGILGRLFGGAGKGDGPEGAEAVLKSYLGFLDQVEAGLTRKTVHYIQTGEGPLVLATLQARQAAIDQVQTVLSRKPVSKGAGQDDVRLLVARSGDHLIWLARASEVFGLLWAARPFHYMQGSSRLHPAVRGLCLHLNQQVVRNRPATGPELSMAQAIIVADLVGGRRADLMDVAYSSRYIGLLDQFANKARSEKILLSGPMTELVEAFDRLDATGREHLVTALSNHNIPFDAEGIGKLFGLLEKAAAKPRDALRALLLKQDRAVVLPLAVARLPVSKVPLRVALVQLLGEMGDAAAKAALAAQGKVEKAQAVLDLIGQFAQTVAQPQSVSGYEAVDGRWIDLPPVVVLADGDDQPFGRDDLLELQPLDAKVRAREVERMAQFKARGIETKSPPPVAEALVALFNGHRTPGLLTELRIFDDFHDWMRRALLRIPPARALRLAVTGATGFDWIFLTGLKAPAAFWVQDCLDRGDFDLRTVLVMAEQAKVPPVVERFLGGKAALSEGNYAERYLRVFLDKIGLFSVLPELPAQAVWPVVAENLGLLANYLPPKSLNSARNQAALELIAHLPALPKSLLQPVLSLALGEAATPRKMAQAILAGVAGLEVALLAALDDKREAVRSNAAGMILRRGLRQAVPKLTKLLKTEKSDTARAAFIAALQALGGDTADYTGPAALEAGAEALVAKLGPLSESFLHPSLIPPLHWRDGTPVPAMVPDAWLRLAHKLKAPGEAGMFGLYLDALRPQDAAAFGDWLLQSWIAFDTAKASVADYRKSIEAQARQAQAQHPFYAKMPLEQVMAQFMTYSPNPYLNSGADSKGVLALAVRATPAVQVRVATAYLKDHGKRVSQAKAVVDMLAASGTDEAVQRVVATATRFKQKSVREHAEAQVAAVAEARGWTPDTLADRSVPTGGLEEGGQMVLELGEEARPNTVRLASDLQLRIFNAEGREVKALPAGKDENSVEAKAQLTAAKAAVKQAATQQAGRLYEAMLAGRRWALGDWRADILGHPILARLAERVVWCGLTAGGEMACTFRPTPEGDLFDAAGDDVDLAGVVAVGIVHGAQLSDDGVPRWVHHLADFEVAPLFPQLTRPVMRADPADTKANEITDRKGWLLESLRLRSDAAKLGYDKGPAEDGGVFFSFIKLFPAAGWRAVISFTGTGQEATSMPVALLSLTFERNGKGAGRPQPLAQVPPLLLSECWCDLHDISRKGSFDADWQKKVEF